MIFIMFMIGIMMMTAVYSWVSLGRKRILRAMGLCFLSGGFIFLMNARYGMSTQSISLWFLIHMLYLLTIYDLSYKKLPMDLILAGLIGGFSIGLMNANISRLELLLGPPMIGIVLYGISKVLKGGLGQGDCLVMAFICLLIGWKLTIGILLVSVIVAGLFSFMLLLLKKANRKTQLPFVPFLFLSALIFFAG